MRLKATPLQLQAFRVQDFRHRHDLTQEQFAKLANVASNTVARWERGEGGVMRPRMARHIEQLMFDMDSRKRN